MIEDAALRKLVRDGLRSGKLPRGEPDHVLDGPGLGAACAVCARPIKGAEIGYEIQFAHHGSGAGRDRYHLHAGCFSVWELEQTKFEH